MLSILSIDQVFKYCQVLQKGEWNWCLKYIYAFTSYFFKCQLRILTGEVKLGKKIKCEANRYHCSWVRPQHWFCEEIQTSVQEWNCSGARWPLWMEKTLMHKDENVWGCCKNLWLFIMIKWFWSVQRKQQGLSPAAERCFPGSVLLVHFIHCHSRIT